MVRRFLLLFVAGVVSAQTVNPTEVWRFEHLMNEFATTYREFVNDYNHGLFNVRAAKRLSKKWREIEQSGMWPREK